VPAVVGISSSDNIFSEAEGLRCSAYNCPPFEASAVLKIVYRVFADYFESNTNLKPEQIKLSDLSVEAQSGQRLSDAIQVSVTLTLTDEKENLQIPNRFASLD
jgi:hypothetical protein